MKSYQDVIIRMAHIHIGNRIKDKWKDIDIDLIAWIYNTDYKIVKKDIVITARELYDDF